jgi:peptidoglycan hydrolase CwlO-like protein
VPSTSTFPRRRSRLAGLLLTVAVALLLPATGASAADLGALEAKVTDARSQAVALSADLQASQTQMVAAQQEAAAAAAREQQVSSLLAAGQERAAELAAGVRRSQRRLAVEKRRLRRARAALARRLVAIYESGVPDATELILSSEGFDDLATRSDYLKAIEDSDTSLAGRVRQVRNTVRRELAAVERMKARVDAYNVRLEAARSQISAIRARAESTAAQLQAISASREATLATLKSEIGGWVGEIEAARAAAAAQAAQAAQAEQAAAAQSAASVQSAQEEVDKWLGGPYSIPSYIVACESGGNYGAVNPSSGAGGAYQILPSTWALYGGKGNPENGSKAVQDRIAAQIWNDSGSGAWVCAG